MDEDYICPECGEKPRKAPHSATGLCYPCFLQYAPGVTWVGGGGFTKQSFHDKTNAQVIRENIEGGVQGGGRVEFTGSRWV